MQSAILENLSISLTVMNKPVEDDGIFFEFEEQNKTSDVNTLIIAHTSPEIFEMVDGSFITIGNMVDLPLNSSEQGNILLLELSHRLLEVVREAELHNSVVS